MTTDELINALRDEAHKAYPLAVSELMSEASERLEGQDKIIKQYHKADCFLAAHGWEWEEGGCWYDNG